MSLAERRWRKIRFLDRLHCNHPTEWRHSLYEMKCAHYRTACVLLHLHSTRVEKVGKRFLDTILQTLLSWDRHLISASIVTPRTRCSCTCSMSVFSRVSLSWRGLSWCFWRVAITILFVFAGCIITELEPHQSATSLRLPWRDVSTNCMFFPRVWRDESSANRSLLTLSFDIRSGKSLMNMQNARA